MTLEEMELCLEHSSIASRRKKCARDLTLIALGSTILPGFNTCLNIYYSVKRKFRKQWHEDLAYGMSIAFDTTKIAALIYLINRFYS